MRGNAWKMPMNLRKANEVKPPQTGGGKCNLLMVVLLYITDPLGYQEFYIPYCYTEYSFNLECCE